MRTKPRSDQVKLYALDERKQKAVLAGHYNPVTGIFTKKVDSQKHKLRTFDAYGISEDVITQLQNREKLLDDTQVQIKIMEQDTGNDLYAPLSLWVRKGIIRDFGSGKQRFLSIPHFADHLVKDSSPKQERLL